MKNDDFFSIFKEKKGKNALFMPEILEISSKTSFTDAFSGIFTVYFVLFCDKSERFFF
jgi:hypothetical protein